MSKGYYEIAMNDLTYLQHTLDLDFYNQMAMFCQQISEKLLKSIAELVVTDEKIIKVHNLRQIDSAIISGGVNLQLNQSDLAYLKDFYFDTRYPGDNYVDVSRDDATKCLKIMYDVIKAVTEFRKEKGLQCEEYKELYLTNTGLGQLLNTASML